MKKLFKRIDNKAKLLYLALIIVMIMCGVKRWKIYKYSVEQREILAAEKARRELYEQLRSEGYYSNVYDEAPDPQPYVGMSVTKIDSTEIGRHTFVEHFHEGSWNQSTNYYWLDSHGEIVLIVRVGYPNPSGGGQVDLRRGTVKSVNYQPGRSRSELLSGNVYRGAEKNSLSEYNSMYDRERNGNSSSGTSLSNDPYDTSYYTNGDDFADDWADEFGGGDDGYDDAYTYWESNHN